jgi:hypothetical protein
MNAESHPTKGLLLDRFGIVHQHQVPLIYQKGSMVKSGN